LPNAKLLKTGNQSKIRFVSQACESHHRWFISTTFPRGPEQNTRALVYAHGLHRSTAASD
jgi:hypothetical protein